MVSSTTVDEMVRTVGVAGFAVVVVSVIVADVVVVVVVFVVLVDFVAVVVVVVVVTAITLVLMLVLVLVLVVVVATVAADLQQSVSAWQQTANREDWLPGGCRNQEKCAGKRTADSRRLC